MSNAQFSEALMESINDLDDNQKKLFQQQLKQWLDAKYEFSVTDQARKYNGLALTTAQQRLYDMCGTEAGYLANLVCQKVTLEGDLKDQTLEKGILLVTERHPSFKSVFKQDNTGNVLQWIDDRIVHEVERVDLSEASDSHAQLKQLEQSHQSHRFDLETGPIFRFTLVKLAENNFVLLFTTHNLVFDAWSYDVFLRELKHFYNTSVSGEERTLQRHSTDFLDYVSWTEVWSQSKRFSNQLDYWLETIDFAHGDDLTLDTPRSEKPGRSFSGKRIEFDLPISIKNRLNKVSVDNGATLFMSSLSAITTFFAQHMAMKNICIGTISANRPRPEIENVIGYFLNLTPINSQVDTSKDSFANVLANVKNRALKAIENTDVYSETLAQASGLDFDPQRNPFFDVLFSFETMQDSDEHFTGIKESYQDLDKGSARYDLTISLYDEKGKFHGWLEYNTDLFKEETAIELTKLFSAWMDKIADSPDKVLEELA
jgi:hypothetical protein